MGRSRWGNRLWAKQAVFLAALLVMFSALLIAPVCAEVTLEGGGPVLVTSFDKDAGSFWATSFIVNLHMYETDNPPDIQDLLNITRPADVGRFLAHASRLEVLIWEETTTDGQGQAPQRQRYYRPALSLNVMRDGLPLKAGVVYLPWTDYGLSWYASVNALALLGRKATGSGLSLTFAPARGPTGPAKTMLVFQKEF